jgi:hypothetical protein
VGAIPTLTQRAFMACKGNTLLQENCEYTKFSIMPFVQRRHEGEEKILHRKESVFNLAGIFGGFCKRKLLRSRSFSPCLRDVKIM